MKKKTILIICFNTLHNDPRVLRQIKALKEDFNIVAAGFSDPNCGVDFIKLEEYKYKMIDFYFNYPWLFRKFFALLTMICMRVNSFSRKWSKRILTSPPFNASNYYYEKNYWAVMKKHFVKLKNVNPDLIIANDLDTLPLAIKLKTSNTKIVFDAHEYHPLELDEVETWRKNSKPKVEYQCKKYLKEADLMFTVSEPIAREYEKNYGIKPLVITNAPSFVNLEPRKIEGKIKLIHHGGAIKERLLEETINVISYLDDNYTLDLMLVSSDPVYLDHLKDKYKTEKKIKFLDPVSTTEISQKINQYDIGIYILPPLNFNNINALPNKFFEFIQARLAVAIGPMPAMADIVNKYKLGVVAEGYASEALANSIKKLSGTELFECKKNADRAAKELSAENNKAILLKEIKKLAS
ncbi:MAG TPA: glycosyltransferase [Bacteroidia bacterium]|jgi:glycosyltransferase involved in cell wall biosynthesis|nr:glycosyltransferase [Bacteroidia bacterium]